jgi:(p)ppGpp synthase/HD superfamily hydrolase
LQHAKPLILSDRFENALAYAFQVHQMQMRKGSSIPYVSHLIAVTALVLEDGGDEDEAIAALLHDAVEDHGGLKTLEDIRFRFGDRVASIVDGCSDTYDDPKPAWWERKNAYLERLMTASPEVLRVSTADKLHNARSLLSDLRRYGENDTWARFNGGKEGTLWYYHQLLNVYRAVSYTSMAQEFERVVHQIEELVMMAGRDSIISAGSNI